MLDSLAIVKCGYTFDATIVQDCDRPLPWEEWFDGHGIVKDSRVNKKPSELKLGKYHFYDFRLSMQKALADCWGIRPDLKLQLEFKKGAKLTRKEIAHHAVLQDYQYLLDWCNDKWTNAGVIVKCGENETSLWGVEYKYFVTIAQQSDLMSIIHSLIDEILHTMTKEQKEIKFWNSRDVVTLA